MDKQTIPTMIAKNLADEAEAIKGYLPLLESYEHHHQIFGGHARTDGGHIAQNLLCLNQIGIFKEINDLALRHICQHFQAGTVLAFANHDRSHISLNGSRASMTL